MFEQDTKELQDKNYRERYYQLNQIVKNVYKYYTYIDGMIIPSDMKAIKYPSIFSNSIFIDDSNNTFINRCMVSPTDLSNGLKRKPMNIIEKDSRRTIINDKGESFVYAVPIDSFQYEDSKNYIGILSMNNLNLKDWPIYWLMDDNTKEDIIEYRIPNILLGVCNNKPVNLMAASKLFPCIKKASIEIYAKEHKTIKNVYDILIVSTGDEWRFYSFHQIIPMEE
jgi:hypothetical protein